MHLINANLAQSTTSSLTTTTTKAAAHVAMVTRRSTPPISFVLSSPVTYDVDFFGLHHKFPSGNDLDLDIVSVNATRPSPTTTATVTEEFTTDANEVVTIMSYTKTVLIILILAVIIAITITGNFLVVASIVINTHLRTATNYFIANLAIADLLLGTTVLPFSASIEVLNYWAFGQIFCNVWAAIDVLCCTASILSLCVISIDRYIGVTRPLQHPSIVGHTRALCVIVGVWFLSGIISVAPLIGWKEAPDPNPRICTVTTHTGYVLFSTALSFYIPCLILLLVYYRIYRKTVAYTKCIAAGGKMAKVDEENKIVLRIHTGNNCSSSNNVMTTTTTTKSSLHTSYSSDQSKSSFNNTNSVELLHQSLKRSHVNGNSGGRRPIKANDAKGSNQGFTTTGNAFQDGYREGLTTSNSNRSRKRSPIGSGGRISLSSRVARFKREKKAAKTLGIVVGVFITCWLPFFFILPLQSICTSCVIPPLLFKLFFWLGYCNSTMNPIIYTCSSTEFRRAFQAILFCRKCRRRRTTPPSIITQVKLKVTSAKKSGGKSRRKKDCSKTSCSQQNSFEIGDLSSTSSRICVNNSVSSPCFRPQDGYGDDNKYSSVDNYDKRSNLTDRTSKFICHDCEFIYQNGHKYDSRTCHESSVAFSLGSKNNLCMPLGNTGPYSNASQGQCVQCSAVSDKNDVDGVRTFPENGNRGDRLPSSCEISMASFSCHSTSLTMSSS